MRTALHAALAGTLTFVAPAIAQWSFTRIADRSTLVPGSSSTFFYFNRPSIENGVVGLAGFAGTTTGPAGVFTGSGGLLTTIADRSTPIPNGTGTFTGFGFYTGSWPSMSNGDVAFHGEVLSATVPTGIYLRQGSAIHKVVDYQTLIPNGAGVTFNFMRQPALENGRVVFSGGVAPSGGANGLYSWQSGILSVVADHTTPMPGGPGTFEVITACDLDQGSIVFSGEHKFGHRGIYLADPGGQLTRLYDSTTVVPGGNGATFTTLGQPVLSNGYTAFLGGGGGQLGYYTDVSGTLQVLADGNTPIPGAPGLYFGGFDAIAMDGGVFAMGAGTVGAGYTGVYSTHTGTLAEVIAKGDFLDGRIVSWATMGPQGLDGQSLAILVGFTNGDWGIYMATIPAPAAFLVLTGAGLSLLRRRRA